MAHIQHLARKRKTASFFGTECQLADMAHESIESSRLKDENALLRSEVAELKLALSASVQGQHATALRLAELMEREPALVAAIERAESAHRYTKKTLYMAQSHIDYLQGVINAQASRSIAALVEVDSE